ncbi:MAG: choice-of-anchor D domain-containing protein [Bryobacteraceae bacterium]|nr:choice-of-anchor D domain-containing protein [Bryobacteraceae bacterium]
MKPECGRAPAFGGAPFRVLLTALFLLITPPTSAQTPNVKAWGWGWYGQLGNGVSRAHTQDDLPPTQVIGLSGVKAIEAGALYSLALKTDGTVWAWGHNRFGQLGNGSYFDSPVPVAVSGLTGVMAIAAGGRPQYDGGDLLEPEVVAAHSLALKSDGTVWAWGSNHWGQLGNGSNAFTSNVPVPVSNLKGVVAIAAGALHSLAVTKDGTVWQWGAVTGSNVPVRVAGLSGVRAVAAGQFEHSVALKTDGKVWVWNSANPAAPVIVSNLTGVMAISPRLALKGDGAVWALPQWGDSSAAAPADLFSVTALASGWGDSAVLSNGTVWETTWDGGWAQVSGLAGIASVAVGDCWDAGPAHRLALKGDGTVWAWGPNRFGQRGNGASSYVYAPSEVNNITGVVAVDGGAGQSVALGSGGAVWRWGCQVLELGCVGIPADVPEVVDGLANVVAVAAGSEHSLVLRGDGTVWTLGRISADSDYDEPPSLVGNLSGIAAIAAGGSHSLALKSDGTVWAWGSNTSGQLGNGMDGSESFSLDPAPVSNLTGVVAIAAGDSHSLAVRSDGTVWAWGSNAYGQLGNGSRVSTNVPAPVGNLTDVIAIAGGYSHSLALKSDGTVWSWGLNEDGQLGDGTKWDRLVPVPMTNLTGVVAIAAGLHHSLALKSGGAVWVTGCQLSEGYTLPPCLGPQSNVPVLVGNLSAAAIGAGHFHSLAVIRGGIPGISISSNRINFGSQAAGSASAVRSISILNSGDRPLEIKSVTLLGIDPGQFTKTADTCTAAFVSAGSSCGISVRFAPSAAGNRSAALLIASNAPRSPHLVMLRGTATGPAIRPSTAGVFLDGVWYLDVNGNGVWEPGVDRHASFGWAGTTQVLGDWNGDGKTEIGVFHNGAWYLDYNGNGVWDGVGADRAYAFGWAGVTPVVGDWNGDGKTKIGVFKDGWWYLDWNGNGTWDPPADKQYGFGWAGVTPLVGDWNGDGKTKVAVFSDGWWYLDWNGNGTWDPPADKQYGFGWPGVTPVIGDWTGNGRTKVGVFKDGWWYLDLNGNGVWEAASDRQSLFGWAGVTPLVGDWNADGKAEIAVFHQGYWYVDYNGNGVWDGPAADKAFGFGWPGVAPVIGQW